MPISTQCHPSQQRMSGRVLPESLHGDELTYSPHCPCLCRRVTRDGAWAESAEWTSAYKTETKTKTAHVWQMDNAVLLT